MGFIQPEQRARLDAMLHSLASGRSDFPEEDILLSEAILSVCEKPERIWTAQGVATVNANDLPAIQAVEADLRGGRFPRQSFEHDVLRDSVHWVLLKNEGGGARGTKIIVQLYAPYSFQELGYVMSTLAWSGHRGETNQQESRIIDLKAMGLI